MFTCHWIVISVHWVYKCKSVTSAHRHIHVLYMHVHAARKDAKNVRIFFKGSGASIILLHVRKLSFVLLVNLHLR